MTDIFEIVRHDLLDPAGLTDNQLQNMTLSISWTQY